MRQQSLFPADTTRSQSVEIPGFSIRENYITAEEEQFLIAQAEAGPWETDWRRRIQQYGVGYGEGSNVPVWTRDIPEWLQPLARRVTEDAHFPRFPENCVINEYIPPLGIGPHKDYSTFGPTVACVSLGSDIVIDFTHPKRRLRVPVEVLARSFWVITGEARSGWLHGIASRLTDMIAGERRHRERRISITFRTAKDQRVIAAALATSVEDIRA
jgi:alkylated DNA repair dioxygenase AlkB